MARITVKNAKGCARFLAEDLGKQFGKCWEKKDGKTVSKVGCWDLNVGFENRVIMEEIANKGGGVSTPLGEARLKPSEFCDASRMARRAIEVDRGK